nr:hypothetical protein BaRGS_014545 [Batillaria attramentaria]
MSRLLSSSADSASLSSSNGDLAEPPLDRFPADRASSSRQENNLSGGSDKELNHRPESPDARAVPDNAMYRTSYSSQSHDGGFDNFLAPQELSSSDGVFGNSSESENEEELSETLPLDGQDGVVPVFEGAGVAEAMASPHLNEQGLDGHQFGAVGDLCFHFDSACSLRENEWQPEHTASSMPPSFLAGQSAARHDPCPHLLVNSPAGGEGEAGGACAPPPPPVNNLSRLHPVTPGARAMESMANGLDDVAPSNFINDESNRQQKVFVKFPMMQEGRDGACGSGAGQGKCEGDNVRCPCPGPQGSAYNSSADMGMEPDQANLPGSLGPNVESFGGVLLPDYKHSPREMQWFTNSESGVSEPIYEEISDFQVCPDPDCSISHNALHPAVIKKGSKDGKKPKRIVCRIIENGVDGASVDRVMIWNEYEAYLLQVKQIGMSACGQTAVLNLLVLCRSPP